MEYCEGLHKPGEESQQIFDTGFEIWRLQLKLHQDFFFLAFEGSATSPLSASISLFVKQL